MPRIIPTICALLALAAWTACTKTPAQEAISNKEFYEFRARAVAEIRQMESVRAFVLFREQDKTSPLAIGEFRRRGTGQSERDNFTDYFHFPRYVITGRWRLRGIETGIIDGAFGDGRIKIRWCPVPIPRTTPWILIKTDISQIEVSGLGQESLPSPFRHPRFTAIFPVSEIFANTMTPQMKPVQEGDDHDFICYEIPSAWADGAVAILSGQETPTAEPIEQASPLGIVFCFLHALRATEANPTLEDVPRQQLTALINRKADPMLIETLIYLAIHPATRNPHTEDYWAMFIAGLKNGTIAKSSGARLGTAFHTFCGLPEIKGNELYALLRNPALNVTAYREGFAILSAEEQRFLMACRMSFLAPRSQRSMVPWPKAPTPPATAQ